MARNGYSMTDEEAKAIKKRRMGGSISGSFSAADLGEAKPTVSTATPVSKTPSISSTKPASPPFHTMPNRFARRKRKFRTA